MDLSFCSATSISMASATMMSVVVKEAWDERLKRQGNEWTEDPSKGLVGRSETRQERGGCCKIDSWDGDGEQNYLGRKCACPDSGIIAPPPPAGPDKTGRRSTLFVSLDQNQVPRGPRRSLKKTRGRRHFQGSSPCIKSPRPVESNLHRKMQYWVQVLSRLTDIASPSSSSTRLLSLQVRVPGSNQSWTSASTETLLPDGWQRLAAFRPVPPDGPSRIRPTPSRQITLDANHALPDYFLFPKRQNSRPMLHGASRSYPYVSKIRPCRQPGGGECRP